MGGCFLNLHAAPQAPALGCGLDATDGVHRSTDGVADLHWTAEQGTRFELEEAPPATPETFSPRYSGPDTSTVRSGLAEGAHRFRVRAIDADGTPGPWSETLVVEVAYMDRGKVRLLLLLGAAVVAATVSVILHGHFSHRRTA